MAALTEEHFDAFQLLLKAPSKDAVRQLCKDSFSTGAPESRRLLDEAAKTLSVSVVEARQLLRALHALTRHVLFHSLTTPEQILALFPDAFHSNLKNLMTKILLEHSPAWRNEALANQISLPRLLEMDWGVDMKTCSDSAGRMAVPSCLLHMKMVLSVEKTTQSMPQEHLVQDAQVPGDSSVSPLSSVTVELSRETLDTMLDGLSRIRDQLSVVASK